MQETRVRSLHQEDLSEKEMTTHSSTLAWEIPWTEEPGRLQPMRSKRVQRGWTTKQQQISKGPWTRVLNVGKECALRISWRSTFLEEGTALTKSLGLECAGQIGWKGRKPKWLGWSQQQNCTDEGRQSQGRLAFRRTLGLVLSEMGGLWLRAERC